MTPCWILPAACAMWSRDTIFIRWPCKLLWLVTLDRSPLEITKITKITKRTQIEKCWRLCVELLVKTNRQRRFYDASNLQDNINYNGYCSFAEIDVNLSSGQLWNSRSYVVLHRVWIYGEVISVFCPGVFKFQSVVFGLHKEKNSWETNEQCAVETHKECSRKTCGNV